MEGNSEISRLPKNNLRALATFGAKVSDIKCPELTKQELANYLRCSPSLIDAMMLDGLPYSTLDQTPIYSRPAIEAWLRSQ